MLFGGISYGMGKRVYAQIMKTNLMLERERERGSKKLWGKAE
ncbi:predicted protein [Histoplasma mississippiense (nom. inval.)]|nr:predicted protein [Histoplasma mississippiense (nom. inval.)]EDN06712.1 predicted protein [Histoplasma mississippiense (nom. inval.)]